MKAEEINYKWLLEYLSENAGIDYKNPEKEGLSQEEREWFLKLKEKGQKAKKTMEQIVESCKEFSKLEEASSIKWLDGSNTKIRKYLWAEMKYNEFKKSPISVSLFVEKHKKTVFRISLEIRNNNSDDKWMDVYHTHLEIPLKDGLVYVIGSNEKDNPKITPDSVDTIKEKLKSKEISKVQICKYVEQSDEKDNEQYHQEVMAAIKSILEYYEHVMKSSKGRRLLESTRESEEALREMNLLDKGNKTEVVYDKNMILYGPPGTGKTYSTAIYAVAICDNKNVEELKKNYADVMERYNALLKEGRVKFVTFHQSYGYEEFIEGIKPVLNDQNGIGYTIEDGAFKAFCKDATKVEGENSHNKVADDNAIDVSMEQQDKELPNKNYVFVIDEINRGNISKIFGELITLIEDTKRAGMAEARTAVLPYSGDLFSVPSNIYILGTMNTADRSISLMDTALRRRFQFIEMMPDVTILEKIGANRVGDLDVALMLKTINERITYLYDREHTIGHAFFTKLAKTPSIDTLRSIFEKSVIPLLQEYFYEDYQKIQFVLGDNDKEDDFKFIRDEELNVKNIFKGNVEDALDLPEKNYTINKEAFGKLQSYKDII